MWYFIMIHTIQHYKKPIMLYILINLMIFFIHRICITYNVLKVELIKLTKSYSHGTALAPRNTFGMPKISKSYI